MKKPSNRSPIQLTPRANAMKRLRATTAEIPSASEMKKRAKDYRKAQRLRVQAVVDVNKALGVLIGTEEALRAAPSAAVRDHTRSAADDPLCASHFIAEDSFRDAVNELASATESYHEAYERFVLAPETAGTGR